MSADGSGPKPTAQEKLPSNPIARRSFMRRTAAAGIAIATAGTASSGVVGADDDDETTLDKAIYLMSRSSPPAMLVSGSYRAYEYATADSFEGDAEALHESMYSTARNMMEDRQNVFDSIQNDTTMLSGWIRDNVANDIADAADSDATLEDLHAVAEERVTSDIANTEQNLFNVWAADFEETAKALYEVNQTGYDPTPHMFMGGRANLDNGTTGHSLGDMGYLGTWDDWSGYHTGDDVPNQIYDPLTFHLVNGDSISIPVGALVDTRDYNVALIPFASVDDPSNEMPSDVSSPQSGWYEDAYMWVHMDDFVADDFTSKGYEFDSPDDQNTFVRISIYPFDAQTGDRAELIDAQKFTQVHQDLLDLLEEELSNAETLVENFGQGLIDGEIDRHDFASGQAVFDAAAKMDDWNDAAMYFRGVNWPEGDDPVIVELDSGIRLQGSLFWTTPDAENGMPVDEWIDPSEVVGEIHMGAEVIGVDELDDGDETDDNETDTGDEPEDSDDLDGTDEDLVGPIQLTEPFRIEGIDGGKEGPLMFDETELPDPQDTEAMLERLRAAYEREQEAEEDGDTTVNVEVDGDGGGITLPGWPDNPLESDGAQWMGLGIIGIVILAVIGFVTDLIPGLGGN